MSEKRPSHKIQHPSEERPGDRTCHSQRKWKLVIYKELSRKLLMVIVIFNFYKTCVYFGFIGCGVAFKNCSISIIAVHAVELHRPPTHLIPTSKKNSHLLSKHTTTPPTSYPHPKKTPTYYLSTQPPTHLIPTSKKTPTYYLSTQPPTHLIPTSKKLPPTI